MEIIAFWLLPGLAVAALSINKGRDGFLWFIWLFLAWPIALLQLLVMKPRPPASLAPEEPEESELPEEPASEPLPAVDDEPAVEAELEPEPVAQPALAADIIELDLILPPPRDSLPASAEQADALARWGLDLWGRDVTFDQAGALEAAAYYSEAVFRAESGQSKIPLPLRVEMVNVVLGDAKLSTQVRRWSAARRAHSLSAVGGTPELSKDACYQRVAQAMVALAPELAERLEQERARQPTADGPVRFEFRLFTAPKGEVKVLARDLNRQLYLVYETLEGTVTEHRIELAELQERDGLLYLKGYWGAALALRQISIDRVQRLTDLKTNETTNDPESYLRKTFTEAPEADAREEDSGPDQ
ncbi:MAG: hypothetical protein AAF495_22050 [Pseudomonadota bacterium]